MKKGTKKESSTFLHTPPEPIYAYQTIITVMGAGGGGNNTVNRLMKTGLKGIQTIAVNTDAQDLIASHANRKILIGKNITGGLGAGGDPEIGERSAEESKDILMASLEGTDMLFLTCGLGGGTGTGSLPVIADIARNQGILTMAIVTMPFSDEGIIREQVSFWRRWISSVSLVPRSAPAAALAIALLLAVIMVFKGDIQRNGGRNTEPIPATVSAVQASLSGVQSNLVQTVQAMEENYRAHEAALDPSAKEVYQAGLTSLDNSIHECLDSLQKQPHNMLVREYLMQAYAQKAAVLASALEYGGR